MRHYQWGYKLIKGPFDDCECPSHLEAGDYPRVDFERGEAFRNLDKLRDTPETVFAQGKNEMCVYPTVLGDNGKFCKRSS